MAEPLNKRHLGSFGEDLGARVYGENGFRLVTRNWRYGKMGEIDLILESPADSLLVFCEVKLRTDPSFAPVSRAVDARKQQKIRKLAQCYLMLHLRFQEHSVRFDVCEVFPGGGGNYTVNIIPDAF